MKALLSASKILNGQLCIALLLMHGDWKSGLCKGICNAWSQPSNQEIGPRAAGRRTPSNTALSVAATPSAGSGSTNDAAGLAKQRELIRTRKYESLYLFRMNNELDAMTSRRSLSAAEEAHSFLKHNMTVRSTISYNIVMRAYASCCRASTSYAGKTELVLSEMFREWRKQEAEFVAWKNDNPLLSAEASSHDANKSTAGIIDNLSPRTITVMPDAFSIGTVMNAYAKEADPQRAEYWLREAQSMGLLENSSPVVCYNTLISAYAQAGNADAALALLDELVDGAEGQRWGPDEVSYNSVLHACAKSRRPDAGLLAESLLNQMRGKVPMTVTTYTSAMNCWASVGRVDQAEMVLLRMEKDWKEKRGVTPNVRAYSVVIKAYAESDHPYKATKAFHLLQRMNRLSSPRNVEGERRKAANPHVKPNIVTYNSVLNALATSSKAGGDDPAQVKQWLFGLYDTLTSDDNNLQPDHFTYGTVLKACSSDLLMEDPAMPNFCERVFYDAREAGQVSHGVLFQFRKAAPAAMYYKVFALTRFEPTGIPSEWCQNVKKPKKLRPPKRRELENGITWDHGPGWA